MMPAGPEHSSRAGIFKMRRAHFRMAAWLFKSFAPGDVVAAHGVGRTVKQMDETVFNRQGLPNTALAFTTVKQPEGGGAAGE